MWGYDPGNVSSPSYDNTMIIIYCHIIIKHKRPNICYIFEKEGTPEYQISYSHRFTRITRSTRIARFTRFTRFTRITKVQIYFLLLSVCYKNPGRNVGSQHWESHHHQRIIGGLSQDDWLHISLSSKSWEKTNTKSCNESQTYKWTLAGCVGSCSRCWSQVWLKLLPWDRSPVLDHPCLPWPPFLGPF